MILSDLRTRVLYSAGRAGDTTLNTDILYALERTQDEVTAEINFIELLKLDTTSISLTANTQSYNLPTDFWKLLVIWDNDQFQQELRRISPNEYKTYLPDVNSYTGTDPIYYDLLDNALSSSTYVKKIYFFPYKSSVSTGTITAFADYSATVAGTVLVTDASHGLATGNSITIAGTTSYNGTYTVTYVGANTFYITATWVATETGTWTQNHYVPFVYMRKLAYLSADSDENVVSELYPQLLIEGASYYLYRDVIYRDQPEKIAFRRQEFERQKEFVKRVQRSPDKLSFVLPKRLLPSVIKRLFTTQFTNYTS